MSDFERKHEDLEKVVTEITKSLEGKIEERNKTEQEIASGEARIKEIEREAVSLKQTISHSKHKIQSIDDEIRNLKMNMQRNRTALEQTLRSMNKK